MTRRHMLHPDLTNAISGGSGRTKSVAGSIKSDDNSNKAQYNPKKIKIFEDGKPVPAEYAQRLQGGASIW